jgi:hypothetical protein
MLPSDQDEAESPRKSILSSAKANQMWDQEWVGLFKIFLGFLLMWVFLVLALVFCRECLLGVILLCSCLCVSRVEFIIPFICGLLLYLVYHWDTVDGILNVVHAVRSVRFE